MNLVEIKRFIGWKLNISIEQYLKRLASDLKFPELYKSEGANHFKMQIPDIEPIEIFVRDYSVELICPIAQVIENIDEEKLFSYLMNANLLGQGTGRSIMGLHPNNVTIVLSQVIFFEIDYAEFKDRVEEMVNYIDYLTGHLLSKIPTFLKES